MKTVEELSALSDAALRLMCAEICEPWYVVVGDWFHAIVPGKVADQELSDRMKPVPDYPGDLNAMHEAESMLTEEECKAFNEALMDAKPPRRDIQHFAQRWTWGSTARQRCIAFLCVKQAGGETAAEAESTLKRMHHE